MPRHRSGALVVPLAAVDKAVFVKEVPGCAVTQHPVGLVAVLGKRHGDVGSVEHADPVLECPHGGLVTAGALQLGVEVLTVYPRRRRAVFHNSSARPVYSAGSDFMNAVGEEAGRTRTGEKWVPCPAGVDRDESDGHLT